VLCFLNRTGGLLATKRRPEQLEKPSGKEAVQRAPAED